ncbi:alpha/beta fold hydrolase [Marivirga sp. S37H4]|uniref:Homoserine O-acetyltransferase n=1 Tax=Marivirga aurantiaca TaxID=2802615 RepID=A0A934WVL9_9BACT|nr:alpha/beta fold hydrolase [Marivirga aurantiaca]MBK6263792.1 alpha/beta fold hydrolase [Marivirga aurantiaca]
MPQHKLPESFQLLNGGALSKASLYYEISGELSPAKEVVWVCHAFTGSATVKEWWPSLFKENGGFIDLNKHVLICANMLGSCYGSTGPLSINPDTEEAYNDNFPELHNRDVINAFIDLRKALNIKSIDYLIGGSLGGQQVLEWSIMESVVIRRQIIIASNARHSAWGIAYNDLQRRAIQLAGKDLKLMEEALSLARGIAMLSYRSYQDFEAQQSGKGESNELKAVTYLKYQGAKFHKRFNPDSYQILSKMMDAHDISFDREGNDETILEKVLTETLCIGIDSDQLFPIQEQIYLSSKIPNSSFETIISDKGHDAFLLEGNLISSFIYKKFNKVVDEKI